jgi:hypothetical protein
MAINQGYKNVSPGYASLACLTTIEQYVLSTVFYCAVRFPFAFVRIGQYNRKQTLQFILKKPTYITKT